MLLQHLAGGVLGVGHKTQPQPGDILLVTGLGIGHGAGGAAHEHRQHAGGHGIQRSGVTDGAAHIQLAVRAQGQLHRRVLHIAAHIALGVRNGKDRTERAIALDLKGDALAAALEGIAHHGDARERAAEGRRRNGAGMVDLTRALGERTRVNGGGLHHAVLGHGSY